MTPHFYFELRLLIGYDLRFLGCENVVAVNEKDRTISLMPGGVAGTKRTGDDESARVFTYDYVYGIDSTQQ